MLPMVVVAAPAQPVTVMVAVADADTGALPVGVTVTTFVACDVAADTVKGHMGL